MTLKNRGKGDERALSVVQQSEFARAKRAALWVGLILPLAVLTAALVLVLVWLPRMPDPAATHWSGSGGPDGFGSPLTYVWMLLLVGHGLVLMLWGFVVFGSRMPAPSPRRAVPIWSGYQRFLVAFSAGYAAFMTITMVGSVAVQLDLEDARESGGIGLPLAVGFIAWLLVTIGAWLLQPNVSIGREPGAAAEPLPLSKSERAVWFGEVRPSKAFIWVVGGAVLLVVALTVLVLLATDEAAPRWIMLGTLLLVLVPAVMSTWFRVRIDRDGLVARSIVGWPAFRLPAADVTKVEVAQIQPFAEFGGWGMRWAPGRFGIVMRTGEGVIATRKDGRIFAITLDDAEAAAAVLAVAVKGASK